MAKYLRYNVLLLCLFIISTAVKGQITTVVVVNKELSQYQNESYVTTGSVTLKPGFFFTPGTKYYEFSVSAISNTGGGTAEGKKAEVITEVLTKEGYKTNAAVDAAAHPIKKTVISYIDGLGRPVQQVAKRQSADGNGTDVVQFFEYDQLGRQPRTFLPYASTGMDGAFKANAREEQAAWYENTVNDAAAFAETVYDTSPLQRIKEQGAPGMDWQPGTGHTIKASFRSNRLSDDVYKFVVTDDGTVDGTVSFSKYALENVLAVSETTDEHGNRVVSFTNQSGQQVLKRVQLDETVKLERYSDVSTPWLETYFLYDDYGSLKYMVPPKATELLKKNVLWTHATVQDLIYSYTYDTKGRLAEKKVPGSGVTKFRYDKKGRLVLVQDANLRLKGSTKWYYTKYDAMNRPIIEGIVTFNTGYTPETELEVQTTFYEERDPLATHYYTDWAFPFKQSLQNPTLKNPAFESIVELTVNYYDDYNYAATVPTYTAGLLAGQVQATTNTHGMLTGKKNRVIEATAIGSTWLTQAYFYDTEGRAIQVKKNNHLNNSSSLEDVTTTVFNFEGKATITQSTVKTSSTSVLTVENVVDYDNNSGLVKEVKQRNKHNSINAGAWDNNGTYQVVARYEYDGLGKLKDKKLHQKADGAFLQSLDYGYNIRGWLTSINNQADDAAEGDVFKMQLLYNTQEAALGNTSLFNGKISAVKWQVNGKNTIGKQRSYKFTYDKMDRLKHASYAALQGEAWTDEVGGYDEKDIAYDHNGNILALKRNTINPGASTGTAIDNLTYSLTGNLLNQVEDAAAHSEGFNNRSTSTTEMTYNAAGSLVKDSNKYITQILYNEINKISRITFSLPATETTPAATKYISYEYDAAGNRISSLTTGLTKQNYIGSVVAEAAVIKYFGMAEGRMRVSTGFVYEYFIKDHQGNVRLSIENNAGAVKVVQENHYYPFGMVMQGAINTVATPSMANRNLYNGESEWQNQLGNDPNYHSTFFREYDPVLGRFNGVDPLAEQFASWSPYQYAFNDPIAYNDPTGAKPVPITGYDEGGLQDGMVWTSRGPTPAYAVGGSSAGSIGGAGGGLYWAASLRSDSYNIMAMSPGSYMSHHRINNQQYYGIRAQEEHRRGMNAFYNAVLSKSGENGSTFTNTGNGYFSGEDLTYSGMIPYGANDHDMGVIGIVKFGVNSRNYVKHSAGLSGETYDWGRVGNALLAGGIAYYALEKSISNSKYWVDARGNVKSTNLLKPGPNGKYVRGVQGLRNGQASAANVASRYAVAGKVVGGLGMGITVIQYGTGQISGTEAGVDLIMGAIGFTGWGAPVSLIYFGGKFLYEYSTGNTLFEKPQGY